MRYSKIIFGIVFILAILSCKDQSEKIPDIADADIKLNKEKLLTSINEHMQAISDRDLIALKRTLSPKGNMQLILPGMEIIETVDGFMEYHRKWFEAENWTFNYDILHSEVGDTLGMVVMSFTYKEPDRDGEPYFNRMLISYDLQKIDGKWYVIKDHASSVEKSTDLNKS